MNKTLAIILIWECLEKWMDATYLGWIACTWQGQLIWLYLKSYYIVVICSVAHDNRIWDPGWQQMVASISELHSAFSAVYLHDFNLYCKGINSTTLGILDLHIINSSCHLCLVIGHCKECHSCQKTISNT